MPSGFVHAVIDLIAYGRPYFGLHQRKDRWSKILGRKHRALEHQWYQGFGKLWDFGDPFPMWLKDHTEMLAREEGPAEAEKQMAWVDHDYSDRIWDDLSRFRRRYWEGFFIWLVLSPNLLRTWAGVDVLEGRIQRFINGREMWESCPELKQEYRRLRCYAKTVLAKREDLREMLRRYT